MAWVAPDMSDRISIDKEHRVTNQGFLLGQCVLGDGKWYFRLRNNPLSPVRPNINLHRELSAPYVVKFVDEQLALLNVALKLTS